MDFKIAVIKGDGVGPEIVDEGLKVLDKIAQKYNHKFEYTNVLGGGAAIDVTGEPLPKESLDTCKASDAVLLGAVGGPKWDNIESSKRPEKGLLALRSGLGLFVNLRPACPSRKDSTVSPRRKGKTRHSRFPANKRNPLISLLLPLSMPLCLA